MKVITTIKRALLATALMIPLGNSVWGQIVFTEGFEASCSNYNNPFYLGCITNSSTGSNWISASGTPDTYSVTGSAHGGSRYTHCYAYWDFAACNPPERSDGIALNYAFQAGVTYKITYYAKGSVSLNSATQTHSAKWYLTNGLTNQTGGACTPAEATPAIPAGSYTVANMSFGTSWTPNTHIFTPTANFNQLWFRQATSSSVQNAQVSALIDVDDFTLEIICVPTPSITGPTEACEGTPLSYTGSITNGCSITNNVWTVTETNQYGTPVAGATEWWSSWASGTPGTFNIPSVASGGPSMTCGKYYRIKLAVQNAYTSWTETIKVIYVNCLPSFNLSGSTSSICWGETANLVATLNSGSPSDYSMTVVPTSPSGSTIYSGPMTTVAVTPTETTTYQVTLTNNTTGCSASLQQTVTVAKNNPGFIITTDITNPSYLQVTASPSVTSGQPTGFGYMWFVDELDGSWNTVYSVNSNDIASCWWPGAGSPTTFPGFDGLARSYLNTCSPANGKFKYNTNYRITRGTWSTDCSWQQVSYILIYVKNGEWVFEEDLNAPDKSAEASLAVKEMEQNQLLLSPNPANDLVHIAVHTSSQGELKITDLSGRVVFSTRIKAGDDAIELSVGNYAPGTYTVQVVDENNIRSVEKLVITK